jgi:plastocyanin
MNAIRIAGLLIIAVLALSAGADAQSSYREISVTNGGKIVGTVKLNGERPAGSSMIVTKDDRICGVNKSLVRLKVGKTLGVANAIVSLEGIAAGKKNSGSGSRLELDQTRCEYVPHVVLVPFGETLTIMNSDPVLHNIHTHDQSAGSKSVFNIAQPIRGQKTPIKSTLFKKPGLYSATCDAGHPWMSAFIMVTDHPYFELTDANGNFTLENVPPGRYRLRMWHEGVSVAKTEFERGKPKLYVYEEPYEIMQDVVVPEGGTVRSDFSLVLRPQSTLVSQKGG